MTLSQFALISGDSIGLAFIPFIESKGLPRLKNFHPISISLNK